VVPGDGVLNFFWSSTSKLRADGSHILHPDALPVLRDAVMQACDRLDGALDGVLEDPRQCEFDPASAGLSDEKTKAARLIYQGPVTSSGERLTPGGQAFGSELNWLDRIVSSEGGAGFFLDLAQDYLRYLAFDHDPGPTYSIEAFDLDNDPQRFGVMMQLSDPFHSDLRTFRDRGGKLILYHGWQDDLVPAGTVDYYETLSQTMGGYARTREFAQLFMVPGMNHCGGGPGPNRFDFLTALETWVEQDVAPDKLMGRHVTEQGDPHYARPVFAYPNRAFYTGQESQIDAAHFHELKGFDSELPQFHTLKQCNITTIRYGVWADYAGEIGPVAFLWMTVPGTRAASSRLRSASAFLKWQSRWLISVTGAGVFPRARLSGQKRSTVFMA